MIKKHDKITKILKVKIMKTEIQSINKNIIKYQ